MCTAARLKEAEGPGRNASGAHRLPPQPLPAGAAVLSSRAAWGQPSRVCDAADPEAVGTAAGSSGGRDRMLCEPPFPRPGVP